MIEPVVIDLSYGEIFLLAIVAASALITTLSLAFAADQYHIAQSRLDALPDRTQKKTGSHC